ncbi:hypothetical protein ASZ90_016889 [hydrocarbon metagenome]|uniref:Uncharacterized protein n=1 Tax=hydrocarbon metagenome TaxID=938273 RepID=A0A0W8EAM3_9ZZZZ
MEINKTIHKIGWNPQKSSIGYQKNTTEASACACFIIISNFSINIGRTGSSPSLDM